MTATRSTPFLRQLEQATLEWRAATLILAVSGGADSVALLRGMSLLASEGGWSLRVAHVNHQLRGTESDADAAWVRVLADSLRIPCDVATIDVAELARQQSIGVEEAAREARYHFLKSLAMQHQASAVAVAHTADDQAETVLHHILRGSGLSGLRGMEPSRDLGSSDGWTVKLIRPLLTIRRAEVEEFLVECQQDFREDSSNDDATFTRNRLRREVLPRLAREFNPKVREHLCRLAEQAADAEAAIRFVAEQLADAAILDQSAGSLRLRLEAFSQQPAAFVREAFVQLWRIQNWPRQAMTFEHWQTLADMTKPSGPTSANLPGNILVRRRAAMLVLEWLQLS